MPNDNNEVIKALRDALEKQPDSLSLRTHLAEMLMQSGQFAEAEREYRLALNLEPASSTLKLSLAEAYSGQQKWDVALFIIEELLRGYEPPPQAYLMAARIHLNRDERHKAIDAYQIALQHDPTLTDPDLEQAAKSFSGEQTESPGEDAPRVLVPAQEMPAPPQSEIENPGISFKDVGGMEKLKEEIRLKIIYPLSNPEVYSAYGKNVGGGILLYGPPGCGKTHLARATAGEVQARFLSIGIHEVLDMYLGQSEQNLHEVFELARANTPCVLFFDEVDALGASRSDMRQSAGRHVINQFLSEMDGIDARNDGLLILAATNAPWHLDAALRRPGRFDRVIFVPPPDEEARAAILKIQLKGKPAEMIDYARLARETESFTGADLKGMVEMAVERKLSQALKQDAILPLNTGDLQETRKQCKPSTREWFATARNYALYSNQSGLYDDVAAYIKKIEGQGFFQKRAF